MPRIGKRDYFTQLLNMRYIVTLNDYTPDLVIYDDLSFKDIPFYANKPIYIAFTGESQAINYSKCNLALCFDENHTKSYYLPLWVIFIDWFNTMNPDLCKLSDIINRQRYKEPLKRELFCGFIASNPVEYRDNFVRLLSKYKTVSCAGKCLSNFPQIGGKMGHAKKVFLQRCKFSIAFENCSKSGYVTEKLLHAFQSRTIPIYWGSSTVSQYFNTKAFLNLANFASPDELICEIIRLDNDDLAYMDMINQAVFINDFIPEQFWPNKILDSIEKILINSNARKILDD
jgi:hypothetical protein